MSQVESLAAADADRIKADGAEVRLKDGSTRRVVFDFGAMLRVERKFGSLSGFTDQLLVDDVVRAAEVVATGRAAGSRPPRRLLEAIVGGFCATWDLAEDTVTELLDPARILDYRAALTLAFAEAIVPTEAAAVEGKASGSGSGSPGTTSTTSALSGTADQTLSSGE